MPILLVIISQSVVAVVLVMVFTEIVHIKMEMLRLQTQVVEVVVHLEMILELVELVDQV